MAAPTAHTNRLIDAASPYLLQHAHNPVDWYPWGEEAFAAARREDKPVFLSVGYSTCYWCHVMERECFENDAVAEIMNRHFINIKVDREERPDVDEVYMTSVQLLTHHGGWPMSVFLEPASLKPFVAGTYFPPDDRFGRPGFPSVLRQIAEAWRSQREAVIGQAGQIAEAVTQALSRRAVQASLTREHVQRAARLIMHVYDPADGGFTGGGFSARHPKFPMPAYLDLLMEAGWDQPKVRDAVLHTLNRMAIGGICDQVGGGFHRYSVDERWLVPHFEKMLYDNGQLAATYLRAFELTGDCFYAQIARETLEYVLREMTDEGGGFYAAQDAEVDAREGLNYLWTDAEFRRVLSDAGLDDEIDFARRVYGMDQGANFRDPHHPEDGPRNVLRLSARPDSLAESMGLDIDSFNERLGRVKAALLEVRSRRSQPGTDDKVLVSWNGLMIAAMAEGGRVLGDSGYTDAASRAASFLIKQTDRRGRLMRAWRGGEAPIDAFLEDYAMLVHGLLTLHDVAGDEQMLREAERLADAARQRFFDEATGVWFDAPAGQTDLFVRSRRSHDGVTPSGNSMMALSLLRLGEGAGERRWHDEARNLLRSLSGVLDEQPTAMTVAMRALHRLLKDEDELAAEAPATGPQRESPVRISAAPAEVRLRPGEEARAELIMDIAEGYHIAAHDAGAEHAHPLSITSADEDVLAVRAEYPKGRLVLPAEAGIQRRDDQPEPAPAPLVHAGRLAIPLHLRLRSDAPPPDPAVFITYQPCTDTECLQQRTVPAPLRVKR